MTVDREKKIAEIRKALEKATPGPWFAVKVDSDSYSISNKPGYYGHSITGWGRVLQTKEDAHLIANAPEWLRYLLSELERMEREYAEERAAHNAHVAELCELEYKIGELDSYHRMLHARNEKYKQFEQQYAEFQKGWKQFQEGQALEELKQNLILKRKQKRQGL